MTINQRVDARRILEEMHRADARRALEEVLRRFTRFEAQMPDLDEPKEINMADRFRNQTDIIDINEYDYLKIGVAGAGSIGSFLTLALSKLGFNNIIVIDDDKVEPHNTATQFYKMRDNGYKKVEALRREIGNNIKAYPIRVRPNHKIKADALFMCVDSLAQRKVILKAALDSYAQFKKPKVIIDGRMHRLVFRVFTIPLNNQELLNKYTKGLMGQEFKGKCTEKGIIQNAFAVVSVMVEQLKKVINGESYYAVLNCDFEHYMFQKQMKIE